MKSEPVYCEDEHLAYAASRKRYEPGETLRFDRSYRVAHLPLVAPSHPSALRSVPELDYRDGRYAAPRYSLIAPVSFEALAASRAFQDLEAALRAARFAPKVAFDLSARRSSVLHVTIASGLREDALSRKAQAAAQALARIGKLRFRLLGPFLGSKNTGRIYFPAFPERRDGVDVLGMMQDAVEAARTRFYVLGYYNLRDELGEEETAELQKIVDAHRDVEILRVESTVCRLQATNDDLLLSGRAVFDIDAHGAVAAEEPLSRPRHEER